MLDKQAKRSTIFLAIVTLVPVSLAGQWPEHAESDAPRDADGSVLMEAPPPRTAEGRPDFSGTWVRADRDPRPTELSGIAGARGGEGRVLVEPEVTPFDAETDAPPQAAFWDIGANFPEGLPFRPWAEALKEERMAVDSRDNPDANCMPMGITQFHMQPQPRKIVQTPELIVIIYEANYGLRYVYLDGRSLPPQGEPQPWWYGYSVGRWEGDTLVVETNNLRGAESGPFDGWLDVRGSPYSDEARFVERFRRPEFGKLEIDVTVDDPRAYTEPFTVRINQRLLADEELIEAICNENQQFRQRIQID
jgi:hypothetical protein